MGKTSRGPALAFVIRRRWRCCAWLALLGCRVLASVGGTACLMEGCGGTAPPQGPLPGVSIDTSTRHAVHGAAVGFLPARSRSLVTLSAESLGPFVAQAGERAIAVWIAGRTHASGRDLYVLPLADDGAPLAPPRPVTHVPAQATSLAIYPVTTPKDHEGFLVAWSALLDRGESLSLMGFAPDGSARGGPHELCRTDNHIQWSDVVPTPRGSVSIWVEQTPAGSSQVLVEGVQWDGRLRGVAERLARDVVGWQAAGSAPSGAAGGGDTVGVAYTVVEGQDLTALNWQLLDADGRPRGTSSLVAHAVVAGTPLTTTAMPEGWILGFTSRSGHDSEAAVAAIDGSGRLFGPTTVPRQSQVSTLVATAALGSAAAIAWDQPRSRHRDVRTLHVDRVTWGGASSAVSKGPTTGLLTESGPAIEVGSAGVVELVATPVGWALLGSTPACSQGAARCMGPLAPTFIQFDSTLKPSQAEPILLGEPIAPAALAWGLSCKAQSHCLALATGAEVGSPIFTVDLQPRSSPFGVPLAPMPPPNAPRVGAISTVASGVALQQLAAARLGDTTLVAALATTAPAATSGSAVTSVQAGSGRSARAAATNARPAKGTRPGVRPEAEARTGEAVLYRLDKQGAAFGDATLLTTHAAPSGGIALAAGPEPKDGAVAVWVAREGDSKGQVRLGLIGGPGHRVQEVAVASARANASSVAATWAGDGWLVAWVEGQEGHGSVHATKVRRDLGGTLHDEHITRGTSDAGDVALAARGPTAWLVWSDARENPREGVADIFATTLRAADAARATDEVRVLASARHSHSPTLAPTMAGGAIVAWIEDAAAGLDAPSSAMVGCLDARGRVSCAPAELPVAAEGQAVDVVLTPSTEGAHALILRSSLAGMVLDALYLSSDGAPLTPPWPLVDLDAPAAVEVPVATTDDALFYADAMQERGLRQLVHGSVSWSLLTRK